MAWTQDGATVKANLQVDPSPSNVALDFAFTVSAGSNRLLVVCYHGRSAGPKSVSTITRDGQSFTQAIAISGNTMDAEVWYLVAPNVGTANIVVTLVSGGTFVWSAATAMSWTGAKQTSPLDDTDSVTGAGLAAISFSALTSLTDDCLIVDAVAVNGATVMSAETDRVQQSDFTSDGLGAGASTIIKTSAGAVTMEWTQSAANASLAGVAFKPFVETPSNFKSWGESSRPRMTVKQSIVTY